jgi:hypothetical protein
MRFLAVEAQFDTNASVCLKTARLIKKQPIQRVFSLRLQAGSSMVYVMRE